MDKQRAKQVAYRIAAGWVQSNIEEGCFYPALEGREITNEKDIEQIVQALQEIADSLYNSKDPQQHKGVRTNGRTRTNAPRHQTR